MSLAAKAERKVALSSLQKGAQIDAGNSCDKASDGYIFVQNSCASNVTVGIQVRRYSSSAQLARHEEQSRCNAA